MDKCYLGTPMMTFENFKSVMSYEFQGIDPEYDTYYWNLWQDSRRESDAPVWEDFLDAIRTGRI